MRELIGKFCFALRFFSRLPVPESAAEPQDLAEAAIAFPLAGLAIGFATGVVWWLANAFLPPAAAAGLALAAGMLLTGALHEDGLADCADALLGGATRERALEIMRDSRIGTYGAAALVFSIGLRWVALAGLSVAAGFAALLIAHMAARGAIILALGHADYARRKGAGTLVAAGADKQTVNLTVAVSLLIALLFGGWGGLLAGIVGFAAAFAILSWLKRRIGGYTGDGLGAMEQAAEIGILLTLAGVAG